MIQDESVAVLAVLLGRRTDLAVFQARPVPYSGKDQAGEVQVGGSYPISQGARKGEISKEDVRSCGLH